MGSNHADAIVVGGGHNGLICAAYLARAGIDTLVIEARDTVGGCASTVSALGARFNICSCDHTFIRAMPVIDELGLADHGLRYVEPQATHLNLYHDDSEPWLYFHEIDRTLESIAAVYPNELANYRRYLADAMPLAELVIEMTRSRTSLAAMAATAIGRKAKGVATLLKWSRMSALEVMQSYFDDWHLWMPVMTAGPTVWGVPPDLPGTGMAALGYATRHLIKTGRPVGGSGSLTDAVAASLSAAGGRVRTGAFVDRLLVEGDRTSGVALTNGEQLRAPIVVTACNPQQVFVEWLGETPPAAVRTQKRYQAQAQHDGYESKIDAIVATKPTIAGTEAMQQRFPEVDPVEPTILVSPSLDKLYEAHRLRPEGRVVDQPSIMTNLPSVLDETMKTADGRHIYSLEILFTPYNVVGGWPASPEPQRWLDVANKFWRPALEPADGEWRAMTPDVYESDFHMPRGHAPSYVASPLATLFAKSPEVSRYRSPVAGLYLSGAGTWPGAGVFGAPGRNAAHAVLDDLRGGLGVKARQLIGAAAAKLST